LKKIVARPKDPVILILDLGQNDPISASRSAIPPTRRLENGPRKQEATAVDERCRIPVALA
jgi:hypothetical protein